MTSFPLFTHKASAMKVFSRMANSVAKAIKRRRLADIYKRYRHYTMVHEATYCLNLELIERVKGVSGVVVECGVWRGGMIAGIADILGSDRDYYLFDSFQGLPGAKPIDGQAALAWQSDTTSPTYFDNCSAPESAAREAMNRSRAKRIHIVPGWFDQTLPSFKPSESIAVLRLDGDWYESTIVCLNLLMPLVAAGGIVLIDDYYAWDGCARAVHDYLSHNSLPYRVRQWCNDVCYIVKT